LFEKTDEDLITVASVSAALSQATAHNIIILNDNLSQDESDNNKLKDEIISLKAKMSKRRKLECEKDELYICKFPVHEKGRNFSSHTFY
jgi:hypothetical protein